MAIPISSGSDYKGTKLTGAVMPAGINAATITSVKDLGMVKVNPLYPREDGKTEVPTLEFIFTGANGQVKKECTKSIHEKSFVYTLTQAATGAAPATGFDAESLIGKNVTLVTAVKKSARGNDYAKITAVAPASPGQQTFSAPAVAAPAASAPAARVGF
jgi:hypothetical protein